MSAPWNDTSAIRRVIDGDDAAFDDLVRSYSGALERIIRPFTRHSDELGDIVQETWIKAYVAMRAGKYNDEGRFLSWICSIARHLIIDKRRPGDRVKSILEGIEIVDSAPTPLMIASLNSEMAFLIDQLAEALGVATKEASMGGEERLKYLAFLYFYRDGFTVDEVETLLSHEAMDLGLPAPSNSKLNNWLSGGRLLKKLIEHLLVNHRETMEKLTDALIESAGFTNKENEAWLQATQHGITMNYGSESLSSLDMGTVAKIVSVLHREVFGALHDARRKGLKVQR